MNPQKSSRIEATGSTASGSRIVFVIERCVATLIIGGLLIGPGLLATGSPRAFRPAPNQKVAAVKQNGQITEGASPIRNQDRTQKSSSEESVTKAPGQTVQPLMSSQNPNPLAGLGLIFEGKRLEATQTRRGMLDAIDKYQKAFVEARDNGSVMGMGAARFSEGVTCTSLRRHREALNAFLDAYKYLNESGFGVLRPLLFILIGGAYADLGESDKALDYLGRAVPILQTDKSIEMTNTALQGIQKYLGVGTANGALPILGPGLNTRALAFALKGMGEVSIRTGHKQRALEYLEQALVQYRDTDEWRWEVEVLALISEVRSSLGQSSEAVKHAEEAIKISREKSDSDWEGYGELSLAASYAGFGDQPHAVAEYERALGFFRAQDDKSGEATARDNLGLIYASRGELDAAMNSFSEALKLSQSDAESDITGYAINNMGTIYARRGDPVNALVNFENALSFARKSRDKRLEAAVLASLADTYFLADNTDHALRLLKEAAADFRAVEEPGHESEALISLADAYATLGRYPESLDVLGVALKSRREAGDVSHEGYVLREMGFVYLAMHNLGDALAYLESAVRKLEIAGDTIGQVEVCEGLSAVYFEKGDDQAAETMCKKGLTLARSIGLPQAEVIFLAEIGSLRQKQGDLKEAEKLYAQGIVASESLRSSAKIDELKSGVADISARLLSPAILLKSRLCKSSEAFDLSEKERARTFLDQINNVHLDIRQGAQPDLVEQEQALRVDIQALDRRLTDQLATNPSSEATKLMADTLKLKREDYSALLIRLKASNPEYAQLQSYSPIPLTEIQGLLHSDTTLVSYFVTTNETLAFVITRDSLNAIEIPVKEAELRTAINWFRQFPSLGDPKPESLKQLGRWLIEPIRKYIHTNEVAIVPNGVLHYLPFSALSDGQKYFGDEHTVYYLPSVSVLPSIRRRVHPEGNRVLAISQSQSEGLPALRYADSEAETVAKLYNTNALTTGQATRTEFMKEAGESNILHVAAHAELNATSPLFSRILLSPDKNESGAIELRDVYGMDLSRTSLVVLSACETQLGALSKGDDVVGLNRAFIYAGAPSVIASLWEVDDESTSLLMKAFYVHLREGMSKAGALRAAQAETRRKYPNPYYWAGFVLTGDPGQGRMK